MGSWNEIPVTYAGGIHDFSDLDELFLAGNGKLDVTIGSALSLFGGPMNFEEVLAYIEIDRDIYRDRYIYPYTQITIKIVMESEYIAERTVWPSGLRRLT